MKGKFTSAAEQSDVVSLNASYNRMYSIPTVFLGDLRTNLTEMNLSHNDLISLQSSDSYERGFPNFTKLQRLDLSFNLLFGVNDDTFASLEHLEHLDLSYNRIGTISEHAFKMNHQLKSLNLQSNRLTNLKIFRGANDLVHLDISGNELRDVQPIFEVAQFNEVTHLYLESTGITSIDSITRNKFPKLQVIAFERNKLDDGYLKEHLKQWNGNDLKLVKNGLEIPIEIGFCMT